MEGKLSCEPDLSKVNYAVELHFISLIVTCVYLLIQFYFEYIYLLLYKTRFVYKYIVISKLLKNKYYYNINMLAVELRDIIEQEIKGKSYLFTTQITVTITIQKSHNLGFQK